MIKEPTLEKAVKEISLAISLTIKKFPNIDPANICYLVTEFWIRTEWYSYIAGGHLTRSNSWLEKRIEEEVRIIECILRLSEKFIAAARKKFPGRYDEKYPFSIKLRGRRNAILNLKNKPQEYYIRAQKWKLETFKFFNVAHFRRFIKISHY